MKKNFLSNFASINTITGWAIFLIAAITYTLTIEPTVSFWDCGEFITSAYKLEVGHPPGAPLFMLVGKVISLLSFGNTALVPKLLNMISALSSAFTILFLFWTITHIAKKIIIYTKNSDNLSKDTELSVAQFIIVIGSGVVGALAYTFSDSFWFSAVEGEVYAFSSFFTAIVFWAILKWENVAHEKYSNRWIILIAYLMGLSIGVHLLNLLAIPAIVLIFYFKKYKITPLGILAAGGIAVALLLGIMYLIIPKVIWLASKFELLFTNGLGLPYNTGTLIYIVLLISLLAFGLFITVKMKKPILNTIILGITVILIGYSSFSLIIIRSLADTPMNQNNPNNVFTLQSYLNREQYGDRPLIRGESFNANVEYNAKGEPVTKAKKPVYVPKNGKYEIINHSFKYKFDKKYVSNFPRMYSNQQRHPAGYVQWAKIDLKGTPASQYKKPITKLQNIRYFINYQVRFMYLRYFMWNFAGRQNDIQGYGDVMKGNWISGIPFIDNWRLGDQSKQPDYLKNNPGKNKYFFLPLILGLLGMFYMLMKNKLSKQYFSVVLIFFIMTGLAIVVYLNQPPFQPRERDYAYAGSFYVFAIFIGLGVLQLFNWLKKLAKPSIIAIAVSGITLLAVPVLMGFQNWDDHSRANRYTTIEIAKNYLNSCAPNAIIFTNGDNDTFPLWYAQEVEGIRTDIRVVNLSYLSTDWYINQMRKQAYESTPLPFSLPPELYEQGTNEIIYSRETYENQIGQRIAFAEESGEFIIKKYEANLNKYEQKYKNIFDSTFVILTNSSFETSKPKKYEKLSKGYKTVSIIEFANTFNAIKPQNLGLDTQEFNKIKTSFNNLVRGVYNEALPIETYLKFITSPETALQFQSGDSKNFLPTKKIRIPVNRANVIKYNIVADEDTALILPYIEWNLKKGSIRKSELMIIDLLANNNWERPIYFATTVGDQYYMNLQEYFQFDGLAFRIVPIKTKTNPIERGRVNTDILYDNVMNKFAWGNINEPKVYLDETNRRMLMNIKSLQ